MTCLLLLREKLSHMVMVNTFFIAKGHESAIVLKFLQGFGVHKVLTVYAALWS